MTMLMKSKMKMSMMMMRVTVMMMPMVRAMMLMLKGLMMPTIVLMANGDDYVDDYDCGDDL